ncbi:hypothetical protein DFH06DRAFT_1323516 [Mycena polygramma]|nr:hypothetical protein DFH06DRAFT_1323516 [Mycena polygramma]
MAYYMTHSQTRRATRSYSYPQSHFKPLGSLQPQPLLEPGRPSLPTKRQRASPVEQLASPLTQRHVLSSDHVETDLQSDAAQELVQAANRLAQWTELSDIEATLARFECARESLVDRLRIHKSINDILPNELLTEIFEHAVGSLPLDTAYPIVLLVSHVCALWRTLAINRATLWCTLVLRIRRSTLDKELTMAKKWLDCSGLLPVSMFFRYGPDDDGYSNPGVEFYHFLQDMALNHRRLEYLDIRVTMSGDELWFLRYAMPKLTHLTLRMDRIHPSGDRPMTITVPQLRSLELYHFRSPCCILFPWEQITSLTFENIHFRHLMDVLKATPALVHCAVSYLKRSRMDDPTETIPALEHLRSLIFSSYDPNEEPLHSIFPLWFIDKLPSLRVLQVPEKYIRHPRTLHALEELRMVDLTFTTSQSFRAEFLAEFPSVSICFLHQLPARVIGM